MVEAFRNGRFTNGLPDEDVEPGTGEGATFGDVGRRTISGLTELGGQGASLSQYLLEQAGMPNAAKIARSASQLLHVGGEVAEEGITPGGQRSAGIQGYKEAPFSTFAMQVAGVAPTVAVFSLVPGGFIGEGLAGGTMLAGQIVDQAVAKSNNLSDAQKQDRIPYYKYLRTTQGLSEDDALANYHRALVPYKDLAVASLIGAATMGAGARILKNGVLVGTGKGMFKRTAEGVVEAGIGGGAAAGTADVARQKAESVEKSKTGEAGDTDWSQTMSETLRGAFDTGIIGGVGGLAHGRKAPAVETKVTIEPPGPPIGPRGDANMQRPPGFTAAPPTAPLQPPEPLQPELPLTGPSRGQAPPPPPPAPAAPAPGTAPEQPDLLAPTQTQGVGGDPSAIRSGIQEELPLRPPAPAPVEAVPTGAAPPSPPSAQGDLFAPRVTIEPPPLAPAPKKTLAEVQADIDSRKAELDAATAPKPPGAVDTSTAEPVAPVAATAAEPVAPVAEAVKPKRVRKPKAAVAVVPENAPDAGQSAALEASGVGAKPAAPPAAEAVPTTPSAPAPEAKDAATPVHEAEPGVPDTHVTASQPPKPAGTGTPGKPPGATTASADETYVKPGAKGAASRRPRKPAPPPVEVAPAETAALTPEVTAPPPAPPAPPPAAPIATQPAPPVPTPAQPAPVAPPAAPQLSMAELLQRQQAGAAPPPPPAPVAPIPEVTGHAPLAMPPKGTGAARSQARNEALTAAQAPVKSLEDIASEQGVATPPAPPTPDVPAVQEGVRSQLPTGERVLEGGPAAPEWEKNVIQKPREEAAKATDVAAARGDKLTTPAEAPTSRAEITKERKQAVREATAAVAKDPKGAHPIHKEIVAAAAGGERGASLRPDQVARSARLSAAIAKWRDARREGGELGPRTRADVNVGGAPTAKVGEVTRGGTAVTETVRKTMDKAAEGRAARKAKLKEAADKATAEQRAAQDEKAKPLSARARAAVEEMARRGGTEAERAMAHRVLELDDDRIAAQARARETSGLYAAPEHVPTEKERAKAGREEIKEPGPYATEKEWRDWMAKTMDVETRDIESGGVGTRGSDMEPGALDLSEPDTTGHETPNDPKGLARQLMAMQMQDAREQTLHDRLEALPIKITRRVKPGRALTIDQLETVRDDKSNSLALRQYASKRIGYLLDKKPKKVTEPRQTKAKEVTPEVRPERAGARKDAEGIWRPTVGDVVLEDRTPYKNYGDALKAAEREAQHRVRPTKAVAAEGIDTARKVRGLEEDRKDLIKENAARQETIAARTKEANGKQSLLDRKSLAAEARAAGTSVKDLRAKLSTEIREARAEVERIQAEHGDVKARIKGLDAYIEHPETQQRRAEEVEEAREKGRKPGGAPERGGGGARIGGRKSLQQILDEGDDEVVVTRRKPGATAEGDALMAKRQAEAEQRAAPKDETAARAAEMERRQAEAAQAALNANVARGTPNIPRRKGVGPAGEKAVKTAKARPTAAERREARAADRAKTEAAAQPTGEERVAEMKTDEERGAKFTDILQRTNKAFDEGKSAGHKGERKTDLPDELGSEDRKPFDFAEFEKQKDAEFDAYQKRRAEELNKLNRHVKSGGSLKALAGDEIGKLISGSNRDKLRPEDLKALLAEFDERIARRDREEKEAAEKAGREAAERYLRDEIGKMTNDDLERMIGEEKRFGRAATEQELRLAKDEYHTRFEDRMREIKRKLDMSEDQRAHPGKYEAITLRDGNEVNVRKIASTTVGDFLKKADLEIHGLLPTGQTALEVSRRVREHASNVPVHIISKEDIDAISRATGRKNFNAAGYYLPHDHIIVVKEGMSQAFTDETIFHEAIHAATSIEIHNNYHLRGQVRAIMDLADMWTKARGKDSYAFKNEQEFIAEAWANKSLREYLASQKITKQLHDFLHLDEWRERTGFKGALQNLWDVLKSALARALGGSDKNTTQTASYLEATLAVFDRLTLAQANRRTGEGYELPHEAAAHDRPSRATEKDTADAADPEKSAERHARLPQALHDAGEKLSHLAPGSKGRQLGYMFRTSDQLRQSYETKFAAADESNPLRNFTESIEKAGVKAHSYALEGEKLSRRVWELAKGKNPEIAKTFARLAEEATIANVHLDRANDHLAKSGAHDAQSRAILPRLQAEFNAMVREAPETKALWRDTVDYFQNTHDAMARQLIDNHLELVEDAHTAVGGVAGLKQRLFDGSATSDDMKLFSRGQADSFAQMREIHRMDGAYFPLMRRGDFAVQGFMKVDAGGGLKVSDNVVQFVSEAAAEAYAAKSPLKVLGVKEVFVDSHDPGQRVSAKSADAVKAFRVEVQNEHLSFHDKEHEALQMQADLRADPGVAKVSDVQLRRNSANYDLELSSPQVQAIIRSINQIPDEKMSRAKKDEMIRAWVNVSHSLVAGNRVETRRIPRRNVMGASRDLGQNIGDYAKSTGAYRAKLEFSRPIHDALARMNKIHDDLRYSGDNESTLRRKEIINVMTNKLYGSLEDMSSKTSSLVQGVTTLSYLKAMGSPANMLLNSTHPWMISAPYMAARHGMRAFGALGQVYKDMGAAGAVKEGMKAFARQVKAGGTNAPKNWLDHFEAEFQGKDKADIIRMWKALAETGDVHPEAGMDVHRMAPSNGVVLSGLRRVDAMVREMSSTVEAINRFAESAAAYRLERLKGATHEQAVRYAKDSLRNTQGLWSRTNAPDLFRNKYLRPFLQFRQFTQMIYNLLGKSAYQAFKGETLEIRKEARRQFAGIAATHGLMAGALGLPIEPIRATMMLGNALGIPGMDWNDSVEQMTGWLANKYGPQAAEVIMHGATRALGPASIDVTNRFGLGNVLLGTDPRSNSEGDLKQYLFDQILGAPVGASFDLLFKGPKEIIQGDTVKGLETMSPLKGLTDPIKAVAGYLGGKRTARGNLISPPLSPVQTAVQAFGFVPGAVAQANVATATFKRTQVREGQERAAIIAAAVDGRMNGADIARWNNTHPDRKISYSSLRQARRQADLPQALGQKIDKSNRDLANRLLWEHNLGGAY